MFIGHGHRLMSACYSIPFALAELCKAKAVELLGVWIDYFIPMSGNAWNRDVCARGNPHTVGKCERAQCKAGHHWENESRRLTFELGMPKEKNLDEQRPKTSSRWVSRRKLSILCILSIPAFVHPSSVITASTSWRRGSVYSGFARRRYNACVRV